MLNILVCVKQVPDVDLVRMDPETGNLVREGVPSLTNPLDLCALEAALSIKETCGARVTVITMGPPAAEETLRECLSVGADKAVIITGRPFGGADTLSTSYAIKLAADMEGSFDLILCGKESLDGATGQMASQLAERFDAAQLSACKEIVAVDENDRTITARRELETGVETARAALPCLITVEKQGFLPRFPKLSAWMDSRSAPVTVYTESNITGLDMEKIGVPGSGTIVPRIYPPALPEAGQLIAEGSPARDAEKLLGLLAERGAI